MIHLSQLYSCKHVADDGFESLKLSYQFLLEGIRLKESHL